MRESINALGLQLKELKKSDVECATGKGNKDTGDLKFATLDFATAVFKHIYKDSKNPALGTDGNVDIKGRLAEKAQALNDVKNKYSNSGRGDQVYRLFNELDKTLNLPSINYDVNKVGTLEKDIEAEVTRIFNLFAAKLGINPGANKDLITAYTDWHLGLHAIGAQHCASSSADKGLEKRRNDIISHLRDKTWWDKTRKDNASPNFLDDTNERITASVTPEGNKKLQIPTANNLTDKTDITAVISRVIDELSNVDIINWKSATSPDFIKQAEHMCLAKWKRAEFDDKESHFSETMPPEKGDWSGWVERLTNGPWHQKAIEGKYLERLIKDVVGDNKDTLTEFLSDIISKEGQGKTNNLAKVFGVLTDKQKTLIIETYNGLCNENNMSDNVREKIKFEIGVLVDGKSGSSFSDNDKAKLTEIQQKLIKMNPKESKKMKQ